jgi:hypothetical protein
MNVSELAQYIGDEEKAEHALIDEGILKQYGIYPFWGEGWIWRVWRTKYQCYR